MKIRGYLGKYALIDLTAGTSEVFDIEEDILELFAGGPSLGARLLYDLMPAGTPWDAAESVIGYVSSPANGTGTLFGSRFTVVSKSPVTNMWNDANCGGYFGSALRKSGFDALFVKGISEKPVYVFVDDGQITILNASHLWGKKVEETEQSIKEELGDHNVGIALIGPAGERKSLIAAVMHDSHRAAARGGPGAVMGCKNLKAIVCRGKAKIEVHSNDDLTALNKEVVEWGKTGPTSQNVYALIATYGTGGTYENNVLISDACIRNWKGVPTDLTDDEIKSVTTQEMDKKYRTKGYSCNSCALKCGAFYEIKDGKFPIKETARPEYESTAALASALGSGDPEALNWCNYLCNEYGYDTISFGGVIAWAMECYENGLFSLEEMGVDLRWGDGAAIGKLAESICNADTKMGKILNEGSEAAAKFYNRGFEFLVTSCGIEIPHHDPRYSPGLSRIYQYDPSPGRHTKGGQGFLSGQLPPEVKYNFNDPENAVRDVEGVVFYETTNIVGVCLFNDFAMPPGSKPRYLTALTGVDYRDEDAVNKLGLRSFTMRHMFNVREGLRRKDTWISDRIIGKPAMKEGPHEGITVDNEKLADLFFEALDWDTETMTPSKAALSSLGGMDKVIADLYGE